MTLTQSSRRILVTTPDPSGGSEEPHSPSRQQIASGSSPEPPLTTSFNRQRGNSNKLSMGTPSASA